MIVRRVCIALPLMLAASAGSTPGRAQEVPVAGPAISIELNKLETVSGWCRAYFVADNRTRDPIREIRLDTFLFDTSGTISRRIGLAFPDLRAGRAKVVPFDLAGTPCAEIKRLLVNDVITCAGMTGEAIPGCADRLGTQSRAGVSFDY